MHLQLRTRHGPRWSVSCGAKRMLFTCQNIRMKREFPVISYTCQQIVRRDINAQWQYIGLNTNSWTRDSAQRRMSRCTWRLIWWRGDTRALDNKHSRQSDPRREMLDSTSVPDATKKNPQKTGFLHILGHQPRAKYSTQQARGLRRSCKLPTMTCSSPLLPKYSKSRAWVEEACQNDSLPCQVEARMKLWNPLRGGRNLHRRGRENSKAYLSRQNQTDCVWRGA